MDDQKFVELNLPQFAFKIKEEGGQKKIFDPIRKKFLVLTPEEWVRQNFAQFLIQHLGYPATLIEFEKGLKYNTMIKRADIVVSDRSGKPLLLVECKAPNVSINQDVFDQAARYNHVFKLPYLMVTNGLKHFCCTIDHQTKAFKFLSDIPSYDQL